MVTRKEQSDSKLAMSIPSEELRKEKIIMTLLCAYSKDNIAGKALGLSLKIDNC